jgi:hypothetical protein
MVKTDAMLEDRRNARGPHWSSVAATAPGEPAAREACPIVRVHGQGPGAVPLDEQAYTLRTSDNGGELMLSASVSLGQELLLINETSHQQQPCRIAGAQRRGPRTMVVAVTFPAPHPEFWHAQDLPEEQRARELERSMTR